LAMERFSFQRSMKQSGFARKRKVSPPSELNTTNK
jgi:hypothetical protein